MGNPTTAKLEGMLARMDGGIGAVCTSSGMGAVALRVMKSSVSADYSVVLLPCLMKPCHGLGF